MLYLLLRIVVVFLYALGVYLFKESLINGYLLFAIYFLVFLIHIVHLRHFKKKESSNVSWLLVLDILVFGMIPIWQWNKKKL